MCTKQVNQRLVWISSTWTPRSSMEKTFKGGGDCGDQRHLPSF
ncbi:unnamed protein product [Larinioides sclopetarius]|uniref:Uncharacterized protein n=1 Tax=Larinioides sclopetarius TaxID=280406 RepID=A0AAV2B8C9_9ARAC